MGIKQRFKNAKLRAFLAISLSNQARCEISRLTDQLAALKLPLRVVTGEKAHLTLRFLDYRTKNELDQLSQSLKKVTNLFTPFSLRFISTSMFPPDKNPRLVVVKVENNSSLSKLEKEISRCLAQFSFLSASDHNFDPHITVARLKSGSLSSSEWRKILNTKITPKEWEVRGVDLMESILSQSDSEYKVLENFFLDQ